MCKLNLLCPKEDGECNCHKTGPRMVQNTNKSNNLLCSILSIIKSQPEIMSALSNKQEASIELFSSEISSKTLPDPAEPAEPASEYQVNIVSDLPSVIFVGRGFPLMAEVTDKSLNRVELGEVSFKVALLDDLGNEKMYLGQVKTDRIAFFRKLVVGQEIKDVSLVVSVEAGNLEIASFKKKITVKCRKSKDLTAKRIKSQEEIILNE